MQVIVLLVTLMLYCTQGFAEPEAKDSRLRKDDFKVGKKYGYMASDLRSAHKDAVARVNVDKLSKSVLERLERMDIDSYALLDEATENLLKKADVLLRAEGHNGLADEISDEFVAHYRNANVKAYLGIKEIGDHPPVSEWLQTVHKKIHDAIGDFLCQWSHIHDVYILNHANVVFKPKMASDLKDYKDHFAGHLIWGWWWEHHGFAGVVTYWVIEGACIGASYGLGIVTFVCGPIATYAENVVDKRIAPPIAERIWNRVHEHN